MNRHSFLKILGAGAATLAGCQWQVAHQTNRKPNVLFFLVDDLGWADLGCFGSSFYETPNIDRLCARSMKFTNAYAACPVCSPSRASIMTGKYPARNDTTDYFGAKQGEQWRRNTKLRPAPYKERMDHEEITLAESFKEAGYSTFFAGKWHLGPEGWFPEDQGFDINKGGQKGGAPPGGGGRYFSPYNNSRLEDGPQGEYLTDRLATETASFIDEHRDQPFLAYLSFYSVHTPLMSRESLKQKYLKKKASTDDVSWGQERGRRVRESQNHEVYAGMVEAMDQAVGKVVDKLEELGLDDNTIIVFMSDNGGLSTSEGSPTSNLPLRGGKGWLYEGGIREPMIIRWPGVTPPGSECGTPVTSTDFYPTLLDIANIKAKPDQHRDGVSLTPLLKGGKNIDRDAIYWHYPHYGNQGSSPGGAIREGDWKLIEWYEEGTLELFNLTDDLSESQELSKAHPDRVKKMHAKLVAWREDMDAKMPTLNPRFNPQKRVWK